MKYQIQVEYVAPSESGPIKITKAFEFDARLSLDEIMVKIKNRLFQANKYDGGNCDWEKESAVVKIKWVAGQQ